MSDTRSQAYLFVPLDPEIERTFRHLSLNFIIVDENNQKVVDEATAASSAT